MVSQEAIQKILGINDEVKLSPDEMVQQMTVTFLPMKTKASPNVIAFSDRLRSSLVSLGANVIDFSDAWYEISLHKRVKRFIKYVVNNFSWSFSRVMNLPEKSFYIPFKQIKILCGPKKIKKNVAIVCLGEQLPEDLPMTAITSFKTNSIITIVDFPDNINNESSFAEHFDTSMALFAYHMTNIIIAVNEQKWMLYNFNAAHPIYDFSDGKFNEHLLNALVPKVVAPISPHKFKEFKISERRFAVDSDEVGFIIKEMVIGAKMFSATKLYPPGKKIDDLPFRDNFHKLIGKLHLDNRNGMSFGYIAYQIPERLGNVELLQDFKIKHDHAFEEADYYVDEKQSIHILIEINKLQLVVTVPDVWVMTLRSGSDKTNFNPQRDLIKLGLIRGDMFMEFPEGANLNNDYKPSFDTKVILAHAVGNAIIASVIKFFSSESKFVDNLTKNGLAIFHWHGYVNEKKVPSGMITHGNTNPHVSCSSPHSAIYALGGKLQEFFKNNIEIFGISYQGDVHVEPHHGVNVTYPSLTSFANLIISDPDITSLGNKYLVQ